MTKINRNKIIRVFENKSIKKIEYDANKNHKFVGWWKRKMKPEAQRFHIAGFANFSDVGDLAVVNADKCLEDVGQKRN